MVNQTFLPTGLTRAIAQLVIETEVSNLARLSLILERTARLGEPGSRDPHRQRLGGHWLADRLRGRTTDGECDSRRTFAQVTLERQLDVVANNIANVNTTGYKADRSLFEEYLNSGAHEDNFIGRDRRVSYVQDRATFRDFTQGAVEQTKNPLDIAINGDGLLAVADAGRRALHRDGNLQMNNLGQLVTASGNPVLGTSGPIVFQPTDHDINISPDGTVTVLEGISRTDSIRGKLRLVSVANAQSLLKQAAICLPPAPARRKRTSNPPCSKVLSRKPTSTRSPR